MSDVYNAVPDTQVLVDGDSVQANFTFFGAPLLGPSLADLQRSISENTDFVVQQIQGANSGVGIVPLDLLANTGGATAVRITGHVAGDDNTAGTLRAQLASIVSAQSGVSNVAIDLIQMPNLAATNQTVLDRVLGGGGGPGATTTISLVAIAAIVIGAIVLFGPARRGL